MAQKVQGWHTEGPAEAHRCPILEDLDLSIAVCQRKRLFGTGSPGFRHPEQVTSFPGASVSSQKEPVRYLRASSIQREVSEPPRVWRPCPEPEVRSPSHSAG